MKDLVDYVMEKPTYAIPATHEGYTMVVRRNGIDRAAIVELEIKGGKYRVVTAHPLDEGQFEAKIEKLKNKSGSLFPKVLKEFQYTENLAQGARVPSSTHPYPSADKSIKSTLEDVKNSDLTGRAHVSSITADSGSSPRSTLPAKRLSGVGEVDKNVAPVEPGVKTVASEGGDAPPEEPPSAPSMAPESPKGEAAVNVDRLRTSEDAKTRLTDAAEIIRRNSGDTLLN